MSASLTTPTGRPASLITGAALMRRSVRNTTASRTLAMSRIETGLGVIKSAAVAACSISRGIAVVVIAVLQVRAIAKRSLPGPLDRLRLNIIERTIAGVGTAAACQPADRPHGHVVLAQD